MGAGVVEVVVVVLKRDVREVAAVTRLRYAVGRGVVVVLVVVLLTGSGVVALRFCIETSISFNKKQHKFGTYFFVLQGTLRAKSQESAAGLKYKPDGQVN